MTHDQPPPQPTPENPCPNHITRPGTPTWCHPCTTRITTALRDLPHLAAQLALRGLTDNGRLANTGQAGRATHTKIAGSPSGSPAWDAADEIITWAHQTETALRNHLNHSHPARTYTPAHGTTAARVIHLEASVRYLTHWATALLAAPFAIDVGQQVFELARRAERAAGLDRLIHHLPVPCPSCDTRALTREDGADQVECRACGRVWTEHDYGRLVLVVVQDYRDVAGARP